MTCPKCNGWALAYGKATFKCRRCGDIFTAKKTNKFSAKKSTADNVTPEIKTATFESNLERRFLLDNLLVRLKAGLVSSIDWKPRIEVDTGIYYRPEATYYDVEMKTKVAVDTKGGATKGGRFPTICILWRNHMDYPLHIVEQDPRTKRWLTTKKIFPRT